MLLDLSYFGRSRVERGVMILSPNLARAPVSFEAELANPVRFREAISALHDIVISDLRFRPRDHTSYRAWLARQREDEGRVREAAYAHAREELEVRRAEAEIPSDLDHQFRVWHGLYWNARRSYARFLQRNNPELWRRLMPCDPVITVAPDVVFFECFSADESSYGCLTVERDAVFKGASAVQSGTTNVDYSWALYEEFQQLRTYRATRFHVDPRGFEVRTQGGAGIREEKIDLPESWLRGFLQLQAAMTLPLQKVTLDRECVYSVLAFLKRHKARRSPRALRFDLRPGEPPILELQPWGDRAISRTTRWEGNPQAVRVWGRQRLLALGRVLPLVERIDVYLLGDGLPSFWIAPMGEMRLTLGLSGWTTNDWTRASALDLMAPTVRVAPEALATSARTLADRHAMKPSEIDRSVQYRLARLGQCIPDLVAGVVRYRRVMAPEIAIEKVVPENEEALASRTVRIDIERDARSASGLRILIGSFGDQTVEALLDEDGIFRRAKCGCSHFHKGGLRKGPCRHLLALRSAVWKS